MSDPKIFVESSRSTSSLEHSSMKVPSALLAREDTDDRKELFLASSQQK